MDEVLKILAGIVGVLLVIGGIVGVIIPVLPGTLLVWVGLVLVAAMDSFERVGWATLGILGFLAILSYGVDAGASILGARRMKASRAALIGAGIGTVGGLMFGVPGVVFGPLVGAVVGEMLARRDLVQAGRVGLGTWIGVLLGAVLRFAIVCVMIGIFLVSYLF